MAELETELAITMCSACVKASLSTNGDQILVKGLSLSNDEAATLAWLCNHEPGTMLSLELKLVT